MSRGLAVCLHVSFQLSRELLARKSRSRLQSVVASAAAARAKAALGTLRAAATGGTDFKLPWKRPAFARYGAALLTCLACAVVVRGCGAGRGGRRASAAAVGGRRRRPNGHIRRGCRGPVIGVGAVVAAAPPPPPRHHWGPRKRLSTRAAFVHFGWCFRRCVHY